MIEAVIFDMDGLLIDSEPLWRRAQIAAFKTVDIEPTADDFNHTMGRGIDAVVAHWYHEKPWAGKSQEDMITLIVDDLLELVRQEGKLRPGALRALKLCRNQSLPMAIASSSSPEIIDAVVDKLEIRDYFDYLYSGSHEPHGKPHPGVFISTASLLGIRPENCLVFEDAPSGVLAAKAAKSKCIAVPEADVKQHAFIQTADIVIDSLEEFNKTMLASL